MGNSLTFIERNSKKGEFNNRLPDISKVTAKELAVKMIISETSAKAVLRDIKEEYGLKIVTMSHVIHYLKIPTPQPL